MISKPTGPLTLEEAKQKVGSGWHDIIEIAYDAIKSIAPHVIVTSVKEKMGALRIYTNPYDENLEPLIVDLCRSSLRVCETCGGSGGMRKIGELYAVRCEKHAEGYPEIPDPLGQMRNY